MVACDPEEIVAAAPASVTPCLLGISAAVCVAWEAAVYVAASVGVVIRGITVDSVVKGAVDGGEWTCS